MKSKFNITFVLPNLLPGGAERVFSIISQKLDPEKFNATLVIIGHSKDASYDIDKIELVFLEKPRVSSCVFSLINYLIKNKPDIVISANGHLNTLVGYLSILFPKVSFIAREVTLQTQVNKAFSNNSLRYILLNFLNRKRYNLFDKIICQSQDMLYDFQTNYNIDFDKLVVINNPISDNFKIKTVELKHDHIQFITVGRLSKEKGHSRIIKLLADLDYSFHYTIIGDGPEKEHVLNLINEYGIENKTTHIPFTKNIDEYLSKSDMFLQGSYYEGFPNALLESCAVGVPVLAFNVPGGTKEIIEDGINGYLVDNEEEFLKKLKVKKSWNLNLIRKSVHKKFDTSIIVKQYEDLFLSTIKREIS